MNEIIKIEYDGNYSVKEFTIDVELDYSEYYDYDLVEDILGKVDITLDYSEYYDYDLVEDILGKVDITLDYSEYYDYTLGDNALDYIYYETCGY